jgi:hypothetical protein
VSKHTAASSKHAGIDQSAADATNTGAASSNIAPPATYIGDIDNACRDTPSRQKEKPRG